MKAKDLMIGDWVYGLYPDGSRYNSPFRISAVDTYPSNKSPRIVTEGGYGFQEEHLAPIPLTPEIFKKNGWKIWYGDEKKKCSMYATWMADTSIMFEYYFHEGILREYWVSDEAFATFPAGMNYLHQLQHALRLCGIEKEIEL